MIPYTSLAQSVSVSPTSFYGWGKILYISSASVEHKDIGIHYFHVRKPLKYTSTDSNNNSFSVGESQSTLAISFTPLNIKNIIIGGVIFSHKRLPTSKATRFNFYIDLGYSFKMLRVSYTHISSGFGIVKKENPGLDSIKLTIIF